MGAERGGAVAKGEGRTLFLPVDLLDGELDAQRAGGRVIGFEHEVDEKLIAEARRSTSSKPCEF